MKNIFDLRPGDSFEGQSVVATCYYTDDIVGLLMVDANKPGRYYGIYQVEQEDYQSLYSLIEVQRFSNICSAALLWSEYCGHDIGQENNETTSSVG